MTYQEEYDRIKEIQEQYPMFVEWSHVKNELIPYIALSAVVVTAVFMVSMFFVRRFLPASEAKVIYKSAYQITNLLVNTALGVLGFYYYHYVCESNPSFEDLAIGYREVFPMACAQIGYQIWAIPVGLTLVGESPAMIGHHFSVILITSMTAIFTMGFSWFQPFMFGILELSSVPLAVMNAFKDNPEYIKKYPKTYLAVRIIFSFTFLYIRWYMYFPLKFDFLRLFGMTVITHRSAFAIVYTGMAWLGSSFLCVLQTMWGFLIIKGIVKKIFGKPKKANKKLE